MLVRKGENHMLNLWGTTTDGTVYFIADMEKTVCRESDKGNDSGEDIFDDLASSREDSTKSTAVHKVDGHPCSVLRLPDTILCLHIICDLVLVLSQVGDAGYLLSWYNKSKLESHANKSERLQNHNNLGEIFLPGYCKLNTNNDAYFYCPLLCCVCTDKSPEGSTLQANCINKHLYNNLFGVNSNLLEAEIVLVGLPNGHVYATPLKACKQTPKLVYDLGEPVAGIYTVHLEEELSELEEVMGHSSNKSMGNCLLFIGGNGKIVSILCSEHKKELTYKEVFIPSQVIRSELVQSTLLLATNTELQMLCKEEIQKANKYQYLQCQGLNLLNVRAICTSPAEVGTHLYVLCKRGQILHKQINFENLGSLSARSKGSTNLKDLLTSIGHVSDRLNQARKEVGRVNSVLEQLAIASCLVANICSESQIKEDHPVPIQAQVSVRHVDFGSVVKSILVIRLANTGFVPLDENWSVVLNINSQPVPDLDAYSKQSSENKHTFNTVLVQRCHASLRSVNGFQEIHHNLPAEIVSKLPLSVTVFLSYELGDMSAESSVNQCVTVPLHCDNIDILHFVKPPTPHTSFVRNATHANASQFGSQVDFSLIQMAQQRPTEWKMKEVLNSFGGEAGNQYSTNIQLSESTTKEIVGKGDVSEVKILQALLPSMPEMKLPMQRLVTPSGHHMVLSVTKSTDTQRQRNNYDVQIQCPTVFLLCQLRSAVCSRVGRFPNRSKLSCTSNEARSILQQVKNIQSEIQHLQDASIDRSISPDQITAETVQLWLKLRSIKYPT